MTLIKAPHPSRMPVWRLRKGMDRRFRTGHPWVYSNELMESPKGIEPGQIVELQDAGGKFLARGFGNPNSLISFRAVSRNPLHTDPVSTAQVVKKLLSAERIRIQMGWKEGSYRLCYGEVDGLPGLVVDRYALESGQVLVVQAHTAGADRILKSGLEVWETFIKESAHHPFWKNTTVVIRNDIAVRKLEGIQEEQAEVIHGDSNSDLKQASILVRPVMPPDIRSKKESSLLKFQVDLLGGQKTGFFLDQFANIQQVALKFQNLAQKKIRILDLFCYVGQWGTQLTRVFKAQGLDVEIVAMDASSQALELARKNIETEGGICNTIRADIIKELNTIPSNEFDLVISDPPALVKSKKDLPAGTHAYMQLATQALRVTRQAGGGFVACSCSALLSEEDFVNTLSKAAHRAESSVRWIGRGTQSPDHPVLTQFPESRYLKSWMGILSQD